MGAKFCGMLDSLWPGHVHVVDHAFTCRTSQLFTCQEHFLDHLSMEDRVLSSI